MKRLYRNEETGKVAGICSGIAEIYSFDPTLVRLGLIFLCAVTSFFPLIITYIVGWIIIPEKNTLDQVKDSPATDKEKENK